MKNSLLSLAGARAKNIPTKISPALVLVVALIFLPHIAPAAQAPVTLGSTATFGVLGATTVTSTGDTVIFGDLGVSPGTAVTGTPRVIGILHSGDPSAAQAQSDLTIAYNDAAGRTAGSVSVTGNLGGQTLSPGLYTSTSSLEISAGDLTLAGDSNAVWIFQMTTTLATTTDRKVILSGGARAANIFWQVGSSATIAGGSVFKGTIMAAQTITMGAGATLEGRALARFAAVTLTANTITVPHNLNVAGMVVAWGLNNHGQTNVPTALSLVTAIAAGKSHTVALKSDGTVIAWGDNSYGQTTMPATLGTVKSIAAGEHHTVALKLDSTVAAWGDNSFGQTSIPDGLNGVIAIASGQGHAVILKSNGTVVAWGNNNYGQTTVPTGLSGVTAIAAGGGHTIALKSDGTMVAWGANEFFLQSTIPAGLSGVTAIAAGASHTVALKSDGTVVAWGNDFLGQTTVPAGLTGVTAISAGWFHTVALKNDGTVIAWGLSDDGQTAIPPALGGVTAIAAGWYHTAALLGPIITTQPVAQTFALGGAVTLSVSVIGTGLSYQWQLNGTNIAGATSPTLNLTNLSTLNVGAYRVVVSSAAGGTVTSRDAIVQLLYFGDLKFYAGITLAGTVGQQFRVEYVEALNTGPTNWLVLTNIALPSSPYLVIDRDSPGQTKRFYRAMPLP
jgi:hypothetical protein